MGLGKKEKKRSGNPKNIKKQQDSLEPDLPQQLIRTIFPTGHTFYIPPQFAVEICYKGVTKTIRAESSKCINNPAPPSLQLQLDDDDNSKRPQVSKAWLPRSRLRIGIGILSWNSQVSLCSFISVSPDKDEWFMLGLTGTSHPAFWYYKCEHRQYLSSRHGRWYCYECSARSGGKAWKEEDCTIVDPHCSIPSDEHHNNHFMRFTNGIGFKGKFYLLSSQGTLAVVGPVGIDSRLAITALSKRRAIPSVPSMRFRECLLESRGKILLVFLVSRKCVNVVDDVEVFRLDIDELAWIKMEDLGDRTLFLGTDCCASVLASQVGCRGNCVYFVHSAVDYDGWWVYDLGTGTICQEESPAFAELA